MGRRNLASASDVKSPAAARRRGTGAVHATARMHGRRPVRRTAQCGVACWGWSTESLQNHLRWQPHPQPHAVVYGQSIEPAQVHVWVLAPCGHHDFLNGRSALHRGVNLQRPCRRFCACHRLTPACSVGILRTIKRASDGAVTRCPWTHCSARSPMSMAHEVSHVMLHLWLMYALPLRRVRCECASRVALSHSIYAFKMSVVS